MTRVYVVEPQSLFGPEIERLVREAGGTVARMTAVLDIDELIAAAPDVVLLDLDFTPYDVLEVLDVLRSEAPWLRPIILTTEHRRGWLATCRAAGAAAVVSKSAPDGEVIHDLRVVLDGGTVWDPRVEVA